MNLDGLPVLFWPALALLGAAFALAPLGEEVLRRGIVFVDLAIAQGAALFALAVQTRWHEAPVLLIMAASLLGAIMTALLVRWLVGRYGQRREAAIGLIYLLGACCGLILSSFDAHGHAHFTQWLSADVLWVSRQQALLLLTLAVFVGFLRRKPAWVEQDMHFYLLIGISVGLAVMTLGIYLVFALLVAPALWAQRSNSLAPSERAWVLPCFALLTCWLGLVISYLLDWPSGATVATTLAGLALLIQAPRIGKHETRNQEAD